MKILLQALTALLLTACASGPQQSVPPLAGMLVEADPAELLFAEQANYVADAMSLRWQLEANGQLLSVADLQLVRVAAGADPGLGLPRTRKSRSWTVWRLSPEGREALAGLQDVIRNRHGPVEFHFDWSSAPTEPADRDVVFLTHALRRDSQSDWFTLWDNMAVHRERQDMKDER